MKYVVGFKATKTLERQAMKSVEEFEATKCSHWKDRVSNYAVFKIKVHPCNEGFSSAATFRKLFSPFQERL
jgi:hypothetical protein